MHNYGYGRIRILAESLCRTGISSKVSAEILAGGEFITKSTKPEVKADWMRNAMKAIDKLLDSETRYKIRESCACCLGGKRLQLSKSIFQHYPDIDSRIEAANRTKMVFGNSVTRQKDGTIRVRFAPEGQDSYRCVCLPKSKEPVSITYCYCCGGHVKHHLQTALGNKLECTVRSSALSSGGKLPCSFSFRIVD